MATVAVQPRLRVLGAAGLGVLCVSQFVDVLSVNTAVIALPDIRADLGMGAAGAQWVISIYALLFGSLLLPAGRLGDRVGHRRLFTIGLAAFAAGSLLCGFAPSGGVLVGARAATGIAAALTVPSALALLVAGTRGGAATAGAGLVDGGRRRRRGRRSRARRRAHRPGGLARGVHRPRRPGAGLPALRVGGGPRAGR